MANSSAAGENMPIEHCPRICHWKPDEDEKLRQLVRQHGPQNWNSIAENLEGRTGRSCRLRWVDHLNPKVNKKPFTEKEEEMLLEAHKNYGSQWSAIAKLFPGRTDTAVKNRWNLIMVRKEREEAKKRRDSEHLNNGLNNSSSSESLPNKSPLLENPHEPLPGPSNDMRNLYSEERALEPTCSNYSSNFKNIWFKPSFSESEQPNEESSDSGRNEVPFYDFLGVGRSDDQ